MAALAEFLRILLSEGRAIVRGPPPPGRGQSAEVSQLLRRAHASYRLQIAGPPLEFDEEVALAAAELVRQACWFLVSRSQPPEELERHLVMPAAPRFAAQHLSADLLLRYLPQVHRRARAMNPADRLTILLAKVLRQWPLSGVLAAVEEGPLLPLDFGGHPGLWMLYAERLAAHEKPAWIPEGPGLAYAELVWRALGKDPAALHPTRPLAHALGGGEEGDKARE
jgi:hypothetical protein